MLATDHVHEEASDEAAWEVEAVDQSAVPDVLHQSIVWIELADDGRAEDSKRICDTEETINIKRIATLAIEVDLQIVEEPGQ